MIRHKISLFGRNNTLQEKKIEMRLLYRHFVYAIFVNLIEFFFFYWPLGVNDPRTLAILGDTMLVPIYERHVNNNIFMSFFYFAIQSTPYIIYITLRPTDDFHSTKRLKFYELAKSNSHKYM